MHAHDSQNNSGHDIPRFVSVLRLLNLKRFPRTGSQVGEGWRRPRCKLHRLVTAPRTPHPAAPPAVIVVRRVDAVCVCLFQSTVVLSTRFSFEKCMQPHFICS
ncbi:unnamed protein product [Leptosia nina]|uniref:Uncharacterized protein n=1 Tax=Leptosia nina TaxID=320188 RepID=A0AAV1J0Q7_9NEOP